MDHKYKLFRQYMANDLGIGREDIETWAKEAVAEQVKKLVGQIPLERLVFDAIRCEKKDIKTAIAEELVKRINIGIVGQNDA